MDRLFFALAPAAVALAAVYYLVVAPLLAAINAALACGMGC